MKRLTYSVLLGTCIVVYATCAGMDIIASRDIKWTGNLIAVVACVIVFLWMDRRKQDQLDAILAGNSIDTMIKAASKDGSFVYLGLTPGNIERLRQEQPIAFPRSDIVPDRSGQIIIVWDSPDFQQHKDKIRQLEAIVFVLDDAAVEKMRGALVVHVVNADQTYVLCLRDTLEELEEVIQDRMTKETTVIRPDD